ncbi:MAG: type II toxin-antitoxin system VapC family toxin [Acidobacteria bacterium]|nr:type II toxin-antitoxin system VapC family toxin [Acidobacteriota bacterium]
MLMPDVNILVYAHRTESVEHRRYAEWLKNLATGNEPFALSEPVMHGFLRIVTNQRIFDPPTRMEDGLRFLKALTARPRCVVLRAGPENWRIFQQLCALGGIRGKLVADAAHAAVAIEYGCEWVSADTDFERFAPMLRWRHL